MPSITWTTQADFATWTLNGLTAAADGTLDIVGGLQSGYADSPITAPSGAWVSWGTFTVTVPHAVGTSTLVQIRSGASSAECSASSWSSYFGDDGSGAVKISADAWFANNPGSTVGAYIQVRVTLKAE